MSQRRPHGLLAVFALVGVTSSAMAEALLDIPMTAPHVLATMEKTHVNLKITPNDNPLLAYSLAVPKAWAYSKKFGPVPSGPFTTQGLGFFTGSTQPGAPVIAVTVTPVAFEIPIDSWAQLSLVHEGWHVLAGHWFPGPFGLFYELTGTRVTKGVEEVRRTSVRVDGSNIFSVNCLSARKHWDEAKETFWAAHSTFELLHGTKESRMESWHRATAKKPDFEAAYPASWSAETVASSDDGVSAADIRLLDSKQQTLLAYLQIKAEKGAVPRQKLEATALAKLRKAGFAPSGALRPIPEKDDPRAAAVAGWLGGSIGQGRLGSGDVTTRLGFVAKSGLTFSLALISPTPADDPLVALRAQRAFEIVRSTIGLVK